MITISTIESYLNGQDRAKDLKKRLEASYTPAQRAIQAEIKSAEKEQKAVETIIKADAKTEIPQSISRLVSISLTPVDVASYSYDKLTVVPLPAFFLHLAKKSEKFAQEQVQEVETALQTKLVKKSTKAKVKA